MKLNFSNLKKAYHYCKRNGVCAASFAVMERLQKGAYDNYDYAEPDEDTMRRQREEVFTNPVTFSILVPAYRTDKAYLRALLLSVSAQTYPHWELILADASEDDSVEEVVRMFCEENGENRIKYHRLSANEGISGNTNQALSFATGEYTALLDHDDLLTPDALYENAVRIRESKDAGITLQMLYSDEDKCDESGENYYEVHVKTDFNLDLLLSNNYICHFLVMKTSLMQKLQFRCNFDGSQDYDLILRGVGEVLPDIAQICHIPKVLYHWRCHRASTAANPQSKQYAYEAGKRALESFLKQMGWEATVEYETHWGFFKVSYKPDIFWVRPKVGAVGGKVLDRKGRYIRSGILNPDGSCPYAGLRKGYSGYMHRASLMQTAEALDIRCIRVRKELEPVLQEAKAKETDTVKCSLLFGKMLKDRGYTLIWDPNMQQ